MSHTNGSLSTHHRNWCNWPNNTFLIWNKCSDKLWAAATVHFEQQVLTSKDFYQCIVWMQWSTLRIPNSYHEPLPGSLNYNQFNWLAQNTSTKVTFLI